jgi:hypothetical protein
MIQRWIKSAITDCLWRHQSFSLSGGGQGWGEGERSSTDHSDQNVTITGVALN